MGRATDAVSLRLEHHTLAYTLVFCTCSVLFTGYHVYYSNQVLQLPLVNLLNDSSLYPGDPFAVAERGYASLLWRLVALLDRLLPLEAVLLALFLATRFLAIFAAGHLAKAIAPKSYLAVPGAMAFMALSPSSPLGAGTILSEYFEQTSLAVAFCVLAMAAFYRSRRVAWALLFAAAFTLNSLYGLFASTYFLVTFLADRDYRNTWRKWMPALGLVVVLVLPAILMGLHVVAQGHYDRDLWARVSMIRFPHHLDPAAWGTRGLAWFGIMLVLVAAFLRQTRDELPALARRGTAWACVTLFWVLFALLAASTESSRMLILQPARATDLWCCFGGIALIAVCATRAEAEDRALPLAGLVFIASVCIWYPGYPGLILLSIFALALKPLGEYFGGAGHSRRLALILVLVVMAASAASFLARVRTGGSVKSALMSRPDAALEDVAAWARANTSKDAVFLVEPRWGGFRALSRRSIFVNWKEGSVILWYPSYLDPWLERLGALGFDAVHWPGSSEAAEAELTECYRRMGDDDVRRLQATYRIDYYVIENDDSTAAPIAYHNRGYRVVDVTGFASVPH